MGFTQGSVQVVAEIGCNHRGDIQIAHKMIETAARCGVDVVKFQKRCPKELLTKEEYEKPHNNPDHAYGETYGKHREALEFTVEQHAQLQKHCAIVGVDYSCSVWDCTSAKEIVSLNPRYIKIPSAMNLCWPIYDALLASGWLGGWHISLGMTTPAEEAQIWDKMLSSGKAGNLVLYHCTSGYPCPTNELYLRNVEALKMRYLGVIVGFSGHHLGIAADIAAAMLGASWIERHFTLDRTWKGTDHAASLEPQGLGKLVRDLKAVSESLQVKPLEISGVEVEQRKKLKKAQIGVGR